MIPLLRLLIVALTLVSVSYAQKETNFWYFGINAGLNFNSGAPVVTTNGALNTTEGCAAISDANGALLFYTDGVNVWNKTHTLMPNGTGLQGDVSSTQSALIVKKPGSNTLYYIFTVPAEGVGNCCYSLVDMSLDGGNGNVTVKNTVLKSNVTEKLAAVYHCNGTDIWVMIHEFNSKAFFGYLVTSSGVGTGVQSMVGRLHSRVYGQMKFSNDGLRLACARDTTIQNGPPYLGKSYLDLYSFNNQTGAVTYSTSVQLNNWQKTYGLEFSRDNSKIFLSCYDVSGANGGNSEILQYNLGSSGLSGSGVSVGASLDPEILRAMQLGPDGKIYVSKANSPFLCVINTPNALGAACNYTDSALNVDPNSVGSGCMLGLPGFVQSYFNPAFPLTSSCPTKTDVAGIAEPGAKPTLVYFDEVSERIMISGKIGEMQIQIVDLFGKEMTIIPEKEKVENGISIADYSPGIYLIKYAVDGEIEIRKVLKR
jgi:hypothetical protein